MKNTRLSGHGLRKEGKPYVLGLCRLCMTESSLIWSDEYGGRTRSGEGHGLCSCGVMSPHMESDNQRRRWHKDHKRAVNR